MQGKRSTEQLYICRVPAARSEISGPSF